MDALNWKGPGVALDDWIVVGHSNGGGHIRPESRWDSQLTNL